MRFFHAEKLLPPLRNRVLRNPLTSRTSSLLKAVKIQFSIQKLESLLKPHWVQTIHRIPVMIPRNSLQTVERPFDPDKRGKPRALRTARNVERPPSQLNSSGQEYMGSGQRPVQKRLRCATKFDTNSGKAEIIAVQMSSRICRRLASYSL